MKSLAILFSTTLFFFFINKEEQKTFNNTKNKKKDTTELGSIIKIPNGFPKLIFPKNNKFTKERWFFGKKLFYDKRFSADGTISCASCHLLNKALADSISVSSGVFSRKGNRNSPSLFNIAYHPYFMREGGVSTLEMQVLVPIQNHNEMASNILKIVEELQKDTEYIKMAKKTYNRPLDAFVITRALATFERSFISGNSPFDKYTYLNQKNAMTISQIRGKSLFFSTKTNCSHCHSGFNFTNYSFKNNGLDTIYKDSGKKRLTEMDKDMALFKVPSLRNVEYTAPYMHNGSIKTLEEVIEHYDSGGGEYWNKDTIIKPLNLNKEDKKDIINFLKSLSDLEAIDNPIYKK